MSKSNKVSAFSTDNPTDKWVLVVDNFFGYVTEDELRWFKEVIAGDHIEDTSFGCWNILKPGHRCEYWRGTREEFGVIPCTDRQSIDIIGYVKKHEERFIKNMNAKELAERQAKTSAQILGENRDRTDIDKMFFVDIEPMGLSDLAKMRWGKH